MKNLSKGEKQKNMNNDILRNILEQIKHDMLCDIYMAGVNMTGEYPGCWVRFKDVENTVNEYFRRIL